MTKRLHSILLIAPGYGEIYLRCECGWAEFLGGSVKPEFALNLADYHYRNPDEPAGTVRTENSKEKS